MNQSSPVESEVFSFQTLRGENVRIYSYYFILYYSHLNMITYILNCIIYSTLCGSMNLNVKDMTKHEREC
jgi:hypothetical protein